MGWDAGEEAETEAEAKRERWEECVVSPRRGMCGSGDGLTRDYVRL